MSKFECFSSSRAVSHPRFRALKRLVADTRKASSAGYGVQKRNQFKSDVLLQVFMSTHPKFGEVPFESREIKA